MTRSHLAGAMGNEAGWVYCHSDSIFEPEKIQQQLYPAAVTMPGDRRHLSHAIWCVRFQSAGRYLLSFMASI